VEWHNIKVWRKRGEVGLRWHIKKEKLNNTPAYIPTMQQRNILWSSVGGGMD